MFHQFGVFAVWPANSILIDALLVRWSSVPISMYAYLYVWECVCAGVQYARIISCKTHPSTCNTRGRAVERAFAHSHVKQQQTKFGLCQRS